MPDDDLSFEDQKFLDMLRRTGGDWGDGTTPRDHCGPHRGPEGPNEDIGQCPKCWAPTFRMRPVGETFGDHLPDCSLPIRHESFCVGGGKGHPRARKIRG